MLCKLFTTFRSFYLNKLRDASGCDGAFVENDFGQTPTDDFGEGFVGHLRHVSARLSSSPRCDHQLLQFSRRRNHFIRHLLQRMLIQRAENKI